MRIEHQTWLNAPATDSIVAALQADDDRPMVRFVGGCVRNALAGRDVSDIDLATPLNPDDVQLRLQNAGIKFIPTGIDHGTVTAVVGGRGGQSFEVTTLRRDIETDGRRAVVAFTDDWREDAARRDLTINAMFADPDGTVHDYFGGIDDLRAGRIRFVGPAVQRIAEDYLRILRYFRFFAAFGLAEPDPEAIAACQEFAPYISKLSGERIAKELFALLATVDPTPTLRHMAKIGVLAQVDTGLVGLERLQRSVDVEAQAGLPIDPVRRLAALLAPNAASAEAIIARLHPSNDLAERLRGLVDQRAEFVVPPTIEAARQAAYWFGTKMTIDRLVISWADATQDPGAAWRSIIHGLDGWQPPRFTVRGRDALDLGMAPGANIGQLLAGLERWWVDGNFLADRPTCLAELRRRVEAAKGRP